MKQTTRAPAEFLNLCFRHFPRFKLECKELLRKKIITEEDGRLIWNYDKTSLGLYFLDQKGPDATKVEGGFWAPAENCFLIKTKNGVEAIKRGALRHVAHNNGRYFAKPSRDFEKLMGIVKPYRENQAALYIFEAIKTIVAETDGQDIGGVKKGVEMIKKLFTKI
jgi:hypothetical protein